MERFVVRGRVRRRADLYDWMLPLVGLVFLLDLLLPGELPPLLQYLAFGALFGTAGGKAVVVSRERRGGEMPSDRVRHFELAGLAAGISLMVIAAAVQVAVANL